MTEKKKDVVLVTGGSGFLGQHIVRCLQEKGDWVSEIRVLDLNSYENKLGHEESKPVRYFAVDVRTVNNLMREAFDGVDVVIHAAAKMMTGFVLDMKGFEEVNVGGTENVIQMCKEFSIPHMVYVSDVEAVRRKGQVCMYYTESRQPPPDNPEELALPGYAPSKLRAERLVLAANNSAQLKNGGTMHTLSIRPTIMYGELDRGMFYKALQASKYYSGTLVRMGHPDCRVQAVYAGNVAWAIVLACRKLEEDPGETAGQAMFLTDDTCADNFHELALPFLQSRGLDATTWAIPAPFVLPILAVNQMIHRYVLGREPSFPFWTLEEFKMFWNFHMFNRLKAILRLGYSPIYEEDEAMHRSLKYYSTVEL